MPPPVVISRFLQIPSHEIKPIEPPWAPPIHGKWVIGYLQYGDHVMTVKVRWIHDHKEYVSVTNQRQKILGWTDF